MKAQTLMFKDSCEDKAYKDFEDKVVGVDAKGWLYSAAIGNLKSVIHKSNA